MSKRAEKRNDVLFLRPVKVEQRCPGIRYRPWRGMKGGAGNARKASANLHRDIPKVGQGGMERAQCLDGAVEDSSTEIPSRRICKL